jgi:hypothetical protein
VKCEEWIRTEELVSEMDSIRYTRKIHFKITFNFLTYNTMILELAHTS